MLDTVSKKISILRQGRYIGDLSPSKFSTPRRTRANINLIKKDVKILRRKNKILKQKNSRLEKRVCTLENIVNDLEKKILVSENVVKHLKVSNCRFCVLNVVCVSNNLGILSEAFITNHSLFNKLFTVLKVLLT